MLPAEWEPQRFVQLTWPHAETDWAPYLEAAQQCFINIAREVTKREPLLVVTPEPDEVEAQLRSAGIDMSRVNLFECPTDDTWARDHGFLTTRDAQGIPQLNDYGFNGWGLKFAASRDNLINQRLWDNEFFDDADQLDLFDAEYYDRRQLILEGGSIESDGQGTILTTSECLMSPNRNFFSDKREFNVWFSADFDTQRILWLDHGFLVGDDTDSHIDTLARLCPDDTIVYVRCQDPDDIHYDELQAMEQELQAFRTADGLPYRLLPLPMPDAILESDFPDAVAEEGDQRLPATYANFLILNGAVLYPTYGQPEHDAEAGRVLQQAFPGRDIVGIDCRVLIRQHGSLHCVTMQFPK